MISTLAGMAAGAIAWRLSAGSTTDLGGVLHALLKNIEQSLDMAAGITSPGVRR